MVLSGANQENEVDQLIQMTKRLMGNDGQGIELEEDEDIVASLNNLTLVGKIQADRIVNKGAVGNIIQRAWNPRLGVTISDLEDNIFLFKFKSEADVKRIWQGGPWTVMGNHLVLKRWHADAQVRDFDFSHSWFWVRVFGVPLKMKNKTNCQKIASVLGASWRLI